MGILSVSPGDLSGLGGKLILLHSYGSPGLSSSRWLVGRNMTLLVGALSLLWTHGICTNFQRYDRVSVSRIMEQAF